MTAAGKTTIRWRDAWPLLKETIKAFLADEGQRRGASLAFFSIFSLSPLFVVVLAMTSIWFGKARASAGVFGQLEGLVGVTGAEAIRSMVAQPDPARSWWAALVALVTLFIGATVVFVELQASLNTIWKVRHKPGRGLIRMLMARLVSFAMVLTIGFLLLISLVLSSALAALSRWIGSFLPEMAFVLGLTDILLSLAAIMLLFALIFKMLPDVKMAWSDVWIGSLLTAFLFTVGKTLIGLYLGRAGVVSSYGAAGSLVVVLLWVYYSAQIFFFGAEFVALYANRFGSHLTPAPGSERIPDGVCEKPPEKGVPVKT